MGLIEKRTGKPFRVIQPHVSESQDELYVGPNWIRAGRHIDSPMLDSAERRNAPTVRLWQAVILLALAALGAAVVLGGILGY